jgi:hypothetical protein
MLTAACTGGPQGTDDSAPGPGADQGPATGRAALPDFCDQLLTPLTVATVLRQRVVGGRSAEYETPRPGAGLRAGMTCRYGIGPGGAAVTVTARAYGDEPDARKGLRAMVRAGGGDDLSALADRVRVAGASGIAVDTAEASTGYLRDGSRVLAVIVRPAGTSGDDGRSAMLQIASAVVRELPDGR